MKAIHKPKTRAEKRFRRHLRVRKKVEGTQERPRLVVKRSLKHIYAQIVDDAANRTILTVSDLTVGEGRRRSARPRSERRWPSGRRRRGSPASSSIAPAISITAA